MTTKKQNESGEEKIEWIKNENPLITKMKEDGFDFNTKDQWISLKGSILKLDNSQYEAMNIKGKICLFVLKEDAMKWCENS